MDEEVVDRFRRIYSAIQRGDSDSLQADLPHDVEWDLPETVPWGGTHHGHLGILSVYEVFAEHVDGIWADPDELVETPDTVVVLGRVSGEARTTGQSFEVPFAHIWRMREGVPASMRAYYDTARIISALGGA